MIIKWKILQWLTKVAEAIDVTVNEIDHCQNCEIDHCQNCVRTIVPIIDKSL